MSDRDDFSVKIKETLAKRVQMLCSNPECQKPTSGPHDDPTRALNIGVAAHITAASSGGPRYDPELSEDARSSVENGIWLCQNCAKLVDNDESRYTIPLLKEWKRKAEAQALEAVESSRPATLVFSRRIFQPLANLLDKFSAFSSFPRAELFNKALTFFLPEELDLIAELEAVLRSQGDKRLALLVGKPATGKTVIACVVARKLESLGFQVHYLALTQSLSFDDVWREIIVGDSGKLLFIVDDCHLNAEVAAGIYRNFGGVVTTASCLLVSSRTLKKSSMRCLVWFCEGC